MLVSVFGVCGRPIITPLVNPVLVPIMSPVGYVVCYHNLHVFISTYISYMYHIISLQLLLPSPGDKLMYAIMQVPYIVSRADMPGVEKYGWHARLYGEYYCTKSLIHVIYSFS